MVAGSVSMEHIGNDYCFQQLERKLIFPTNQAAISKLDCFGLIELIDVGLVNSGASEWQPTN